RRGPQGEGVGVLPRPFDHPSGARPGDARQDRGEGRGRRHRRPDAAPRGPQHVDDAGGEVERGKPMPKIKTSRGAAKRFKMTGTGRGNRGRGSLRHTLTNKPQKQKRGLGRSVWVERRKEKPTKPLPPYFKGDKTIPRERGAPKTPPRHKKTMKQAKGYVGGRR